MILGSEFVKNTYRMVPTISPPKKGENFSKVGGGLWRQGGAYGDTNFFFFSKLKIDSFLERSDMVGIVCGCGAQKLDSEGEFHVFTKE